jgi:hypothetical protein
MNKWSDQTDPCMIEYVTYDDVLHVRLHKEGVVLFCRKDIGMSF